MNITIKATSSTERVKEIKKQFADALKNGIDIGE